MPTITLNWKVVEKAEDFDTKDVSRYLSSHGGVYLWIINLKYVCYVGKANKFWDRFITHFINTISGFSTCFYPEENADFIEYLHDNYASKDYFDLATKNDNIYLPTAHYAGIFPSSVKNTFLDLLSIEKRIKFLNSLQFAFASITNDDTNSRISYEDVESTIILNLKNHYDPDGNISLKKSKIKELSRVRRDGYIGNITRYPTKSFDIIHINDPANPKIIPPEVFNIVRCNP